MPFAANISHDHVYWEDCDSQVHIFSTWYVRCLGSVGKHLNQMNYLVDTNVLKFFFFSFTLSLAFSRVFTFYVFVTILLLLDPEAMCLTFSIRVFVLDVWDVCVSYPLFDTIHTEFKIFLNKKLLAIAPLLLHLWCCLWLMAILLYLWWPGSVVTLPCASGNNKVLVICYMYLHLFSSGEHNKISKKEGRLKLSP